MAESYFSLKQKLEELGYTGHLSSDTVPLMECVLADLVQTTRSLQHYMDLAKDAFKQRDDLVALLDPYKSDNTKLLNENINLNKLVMIMKEEQQKLCLESSRLKKTLNAEISSKDAIISKLQHELANLNSKGLRVSTISTRNKSSAKFSSNLKNDYFTCHCKVTEHPVYNEKQLITMKNTISNLKAQNSAYCDEIEILKEQVSNRESEISKLSMLLAGGRPLKAFYKDDYQASQIEIQNLTKQVDELRLLNSELEKKLQDVLNKQHEAMLRALALADENKSLSEELVKLDSLALQVEEDCNGEITIAMNELTRLKSQLNELQLKNNNLERKLEQKNDNKNHNTPNNFDTLMKEIKIIQESLQSTQNKKEFLMDQLNDFIHNKSCSFTKSDSSLYATKDDLKLFLDKEKEIYACQISLIQKKIDEISNLFYQHLESKNHNNEKKTNSEYILELNKKNCELAQENFKLKQQIDFSKPSLSNQNICKHQALEEVIAHLNKENADLNQDNIALSRLLSKKEKEILESEPKSQSTLREKCCIIERLKEDNILLKKDKQEYIQKYKNSCKTVDNLKKDLAIKQKELEKLEEENNFYKIGTRSDKASTEHLKEECRSLKEQIKKMQSDVIKEKTLVSQIKNIQAETERSSNDLNNELMLVQKQLSSSKDDYNCLEKKCKDLKFELHALKLDKQKLIEDIKTIDKEKDKLIIEIDNKTEMVCTLEQKLKSQLFEIEQLENENVELKRKLNMEKVTQHKLSDFEAQIQYLNGEIRRITLHLENAMAENKSLQCNLLEANTALKTTKIENEKVRKEADSLRQQLQHYVVEVKRIEDLLSQKEAERADMLEHFASLSVEANLLETNNQTLENETASKAAQLQSSWNQNQELETRIADKEKTIDRQSAQIASLNCKVISLENEIKLLKEENILYEKNITYLKQLFSNSEVNTKKHSEHMEDSSTEKLALECEIMKMKEYEMNTERILSNAKKEILDLKLALQDATSETRELKRKMHKLKNRVMYISEEREISTSTREQSLAINPDSGMRDEYDGDTTNESTRNRFTYTKHSSTF